VSAQPAKVGSASADPANAGQAPPIVLSISPPDANWGRKRDDRGGEYWAPFDLANGHSTKRGQTIPPAGGKTISIRLLPR
jgi:hypothetical protein